MAKMGMLAGTRCLRCFAYELGILFAVSAGMSLLISQGALEVFRRYVFVSATRMPLTPLAQTAAPVGPLPEGPRGRGQRRRLASLATRGDSAFVLDLGSTSCRGASGLAGEKRQRAAAVQESYGGGWGGDGGFWGRAFLGSGGSLDSGGGPALVVRVGSGSSFYFPAPLFCAWLRFSGRCPSRIC